MFLTGRLVTNLQKFKIIMVEQVEKSKSNKTIEKIRALTNKVFQSRDVYDIHQWLLKFIATIREYLNKQKGRKST